MNGNLKGGRIAMRVLVLEDQEYIRLLLVVLLRKLGFTVEAVAGRTEGFAAFQRVMPDVVVCDLAMPDGDGFSFIKRVRSLTDEAGGSVPAIALSTFSAPNVVDLALGAGFNRFLAKPVDIHRLASVIRELLGESRLMDLP